MKGLTMPDEIDDLGLEPTIEGEPGPEGGEPGGAPPPTPEYLDLDDATASKLVRIKVQGEDVEVPLREALAGYSRTDDYTRKTQALADRERQLQFAQTLQQALEASPKETLQLLAQRYGVDFANQVADQTGNDRVDDDDDDLYSDPLEKRIAAQERMLQQIQMDREQQLADARLDRAVQGLKTQFNATDEQVRQVAQLAFQNRMAPEQFPMIFQAIAYQSLQQTRSAQEAAEAARREAAAQAAAATGAGAGAGNTQPNPPGAPPQVNSLEEAFNLAWEQGGGG